MSISAFGGLFFPKLVNQKLMDSALVCDAKSPNYAGWETTFGGDVPLHRYFYVYDVSNAEEVLMTGAKPKVNEIGPFVHRCYTKKTNVVFDQDTVSYSSYMMCEFEKDDAANCEDCADLQLPVTT